MHRLTVWAATEQRERERERHWWEGGDGDSEGKKHYKERQSQTDGGEEELSLTGGEQIPLTLTDSGGEAGRGTTGIGREGGLVQQKGREGVAVKVAEGN